MNKIVSKTLGGLSPQYYFRQFVFGLLFTGFFTWFIWWVSMKSKHPVEIGMIAFFVINTILYPYSRFVYESIMNFIIGVNVFRLKASVVLLVKFFTMFFCWLFAVFIAPVGLVYLYFYHSKAEKKAQQKEI